MNQHNPVELQAQAEQQKDRDTRASLARETELADVRWLMGSKRGRRIIWRLLASAQTFHSSFNTNAMTMAFNEGRRNHGVQLLTLVHAATPDLYPTMVNENQ